MANPQTLGERLILLTMNEDPEGRSSHLQIGFTSGAGVLSAVYPAEIVEHGRMKGLVELDPGSALVAPHNGAGPPLQTFRAEEDLVPRVELQIERLDLAACDCQIRDGNILACPGRLYGAMHGNRLALFYARHGLIASTRSRSAAVVSAPPMTDEATWGVIASDWPGATVDH